MNSQSERTTSRVQTISVPPRWGILPLRYGGGRSRRASPRRRAFRRGAARRGVSVVEFAIVSNVLFLSIFICIEFARVNMIRNLVQDAAYFAARTAIVPGATEQDAVAEAERILGMLNTQEVEIEVNDGAAVTDSTRELNVRVRVPLGPNTLFLTKFTGEKEIEANARMKTERYDGFFSLQ